MNNPEQRLQKYREMGIWRMLRDVRALPGGMARMSDGREVINLASNDYLGLSHAPEIAEAWVKVVRDHGAGSGASRLVTGTSPAHTELEEALAAFKHAEAALSFSSGYAASLGVITSIADKATHIVLDKLSHASLIDGAKLSGAVLHTFLHNDTASLRKKLEHIRNKDAKADILIVTESVFSMDGDWAPLREIVTLKDEFNAALLVDEAHAVGVLGDDGGGLASLLGLHTRVEFQMGTLSKAVGLSGGYVACSAAWKQVMVNSARSFIYSTAPPPALAMACTASLRLIQSEYGKELRDRLNALITLFNQELNGKLQSHSSIFPLIVGDNDQAVAKAEQLLEQGILAPAIRYPTVPQGTARLRMTLTAAHSEAQIRHVLAALSMA